jgi:3-deoxy-D-manno-octulosonic-acid transferase
MAFIHILTTVVLPAVAILWLAKVFLRRSRTAGMTAGLSGQLAVETPSPGNSAPPPGESFQELCFWVHAVSAGEVMGAVPLVKGLQARFPGARIVLSTLTATGRQVARQRCGDIEVIRYRHLDFLLNPERVISKISPTIFLPLEAELWPSLIRRLSRRGVPCALMNGRVSRRRVRYGFFYKSALRRIAFFSVQTEADAEQLMALGVSRSKVAVTGNTKFSQAAQSAADAGTKSVPLPEGSHLLIGGSTHDGEEAELSRRAIWSVSNGWSGWSVRTALLAFGGANSAAQSARR